MDVSPVARAAQIAALGHRRPLDEAELAAARAASGDPGPAVRAAAIGALARGAPVRIASPAWHNAAGDPDASVRRRAADLAPKLAARRRAPDPALTSALIALLEDADVTVVEAAAWALGETVTASSQASDTAVPALSRVVTDHRDALAREAAVAALGAIGDERGLDAILVACRDKPAVRRRAVLALAPFTGTAVDAAIAAALDDRDWQVRQAAEDLGAESVDV